MSIGSALSWPQYPTAKAANQLVKQGVVVVASIGNEGALGLYGASAPGVGKDVIGVASFDNTHANLASLHDLSRWGEDWVRRRERRPDSAVDRLVSDGSNRHRDVRRRRLQRRHSAGSPLPAGSLTGRVALIRRGTCSFYEKAFNAQSAGAAGVVLYNNVPGFISPTVADAANHDSGRQHHRRQGRPDRQAPRERSGDDDVDVDHRE